MVHVNNRMFAYYDQTFDLILPVTYIYVCYISTARSYDPGVR